MFTVLLSGGSGKRLWPLSNDLRSKQYIKIFDDETNENHTLSMVQRVVGQLKDAGIDNNMLICAGNSQVEIIHSQLGDIGIAVEPERRDTFPAIALSCAYAKSRCGATDDDCLTVLPVDPYADERYFQTLKTLETYLKKSGASMALMGAVPDIPTSKLGYILKGQEKDGYFEVKGFKEKPDTETAKKLIEEGALYNCGVFCFKIGLITAILEKLGVKADYDFLYKNYELLPKISFDYQVVEKQDNMIVVPFKGLWKDLGTWNSLSEEMNKEILGNALTDGCKKTKIINELDIPIVALGLENTVIAASVDGILVTDKEHSEKIKEVIDKVSLPPMYEERRWGTLKTIERTEDTLTRHVKMFAGMNSSFHYHQNRNEVWVFLKGKGEMILGNNKMTVKPGLSVTIPKNEKHIIMAQTDIEFLEVHIGEGNGDDIKRLSFDWESVKEKQVRGEL